MNTELGRRTYLLYIEFVEAGYASGKSPNARKPTYLPRYRFWFFLNLVFVACPYPVGSRLWKSARVFLTPVVVPLPLISHFQSC